MINNADQFSQPSLVRFTKDVTKGADIFGHDCICVVLTLVIMM